MIFVFFWNFEKQILTIFTAIHPPQSSQIYFCLPTPHNFVPPFYSLWILSVQQMFTLVKESSTGE